MLIIMIVLLILYVATLSGRIMSMIMSRSNGGVAVVTCRTSILLPGNWNEC
jgi:hypothetical protein